MPGAAHEKAPAGFPAGALSTRRRRFASSQRTVIPRPGDRERDARRLDVDEHPLPEEARTRPLVAGMIARRHASDDAAATLVEHSIDMRNVGRRQVDAVLGKDEGLAALRQ